MPEGSTATDSDDLSANDTTFVEVAGADVVPLSGPLGGDCQTSGYGTVRCVPLLSLSAGASPSVLQSTKHLRRVGACVTIHTCLSTRSNQLP
jgi:hypothetical protein